MPEFVFATCAIGVEPAMKREVARTRPELRFAYSRPGLVTWKSEQPIAPDDAPGSAFARVWGKSLGEAPMPPVDRIHTYKRDPDDEIAVAPSEPARPGELVGDVVVATGDKPFHGVHRAAFAHHAGGDFGVVVPEDAPSRAYAKIEEAIAWASLPVHAGQTAVEIGSSPGGAAMALAKRGLTVIGVDPGEMAPQVTALGVKHLAIKVGALRWEDLPKRVDWLLCDVNLAPQVALHELARLMPPMRAHLKGAVITLKLNDWSFVDELPALVKRIEQMGLPRVRLRHLPSNRKELCAVATR